DVARFPEGLEVRPLDAMAGSRLAHDLVEMAKPLHFGAAFGEVVAEAKPFCQIRKDIEVVARLANRLDRLMHGEHVAVGGGCGVGSFKGRGGGGHDAWRARSWC